ncbi:MAG: hypothetical protein WCP28_11975 [Actinomycetes bacterium]
MARMDKRSAWAQDEIGVLTASGVCSTGSQEPWSIGRWRLDSQVLRFEAPGENRNVSVPLGNVRRLETTRRKFLVVAKPVLVVTYLPRSVAKLRRLWLLTADLSAWEDALTVHAPSLRPAAEQNPIDRAAALTRALQLVTGQTAAVLDLLAFGNPATSAMLAAALQLDERDSANLARALTGGFAGVDRALGASALRYERRRFEASTATVHSMSWWLDESVAGAWLALREPLETHLDGDKVVVITGVSTRSSEASLSVQVTADGRGLLLAGSRGYSRYIELPVAVDDDVDMAVHLNGTLVITGQRRPTDHSVEPIGTVSGQGGERD